MPRPTPKVTSYTPETMTDEVYLHITPELGWNGAIKGFRVTKMAKSREAAVAPNAYVVKIEVALGKAFFADAIPTRRVEIEAGQVVGLVEALTLSVADGETFVSEQMLADEEANR